MAFVYSAEGDMVCPRGDTGALKVTVSGITLNAGDMLVFGVFDPVRGRTLLRKQAEIVNGEAILTFTNADTRGLRPGMYRYNLRIVTDPELDEKGNVVCLDDTDNVISVYNEMPRFWVKEAGVHV